MTRSALTLALLLTACGAAPVKGQVLLAGITLIDTAGEETWIDVGPDRTAAIQDCLTKTKSSSKGAVKEEALHEGTYRVQFADERGEHTWILMNTVDMQNGDTYYKNDCLYELIPG